jgi:hypothetical protein
MSDQPEALRLSEALYAVPETGAFPEDIKAAADELRRLHDNNEVLMNALWKACGDDEEVVNATIESQGVLK